MRQEYTESFTADMLCSSSELAICLDEDQIAIHDILQAGKYPIAEAARPRLCADRLDGIFSGLYLWTQTKTLEEIRTMYQALMVVQDSDGKAELGFVSEEMATKFFYWSVENGRGYLQAEDLYEMQLLGRIVHDCIQNGVFSEEELFQTTEEEIWNRIQTLDIPEIRKKVTVFEQVQEVKTSVVSPTEHLSFPVKTKFRYVDPLVKKELYGVRLSKVDPDVQKDLELFLHSVSFHFVYTLEL